VIRSVPERPAVSVVIPAYNEEERIGTTIGAIAAYGAARGLALEILLADDGSRDATRDRAAAAAHGRVPLHILPAPENRGKGDAVRRGMLAATGALVLFTDADLSTPIEAFDAFRRAFEGGAAFIIGSRKLEPELVVQRQPALRQALGRGFSALARRLVHPGVTDFTCGFKACRSEVVPVLFSPLTRRDWSFDAELLCIARRRGVPVLELPVPWANRPETRVRLARDVVRSAIGLAAIVARAARGAYDAG